jgi:hypothetical protein
VRDRDLLLLKFHIPHDVSILGAKTREFATSSFCMLSFHLHVIANVLTINNNLQTSTP